MGSDMARFLTNVRKSMLSCRRIRTIPQDFLYALSAQQLTLRSLLPHLDPLILPSKSQPTLTAQPVLEHESKERAHILTTLLTDSPSRGSFFPQVPQHFPRFPGKHTYQFEEIFTSRETDPRKVRERATEEGRLGEGALRNLVSVHVVAPPTTSSRPRNYKLPVREQGRALWKATMESVLKAENEDPAGRATKLKPDNTELDIADASHNAASSYFGSTVNAERRYWRKGSMQRT